MSSLFRYLLVGVGLMAASALLAACGGGGEELGLDEYFQRLEDVKEEADARGAALEEGGSLESAGHVEAFQEYFDEFEAIYEGVVNGVKDIDPPSEARNAHDEFVVALEEAQKALREFADRVGEAESFSDLEALIGAVAEPGFEAALEGVEDACRELQEVADENDIEIDLECEEEA